MSLTQQKEDSFYQLLQLGPHQMKALIKSKPKGQRGKYILNMIVRNILIVGFALFFVGGANVIFGSNNTSVAIAYFCILLQSRYVNYGYKFRDLLVNLGIMSLIFAIDNQISPNLPPLLALVANLIFISIIVFMTCHNPRLGNVAVYVDSYLFTTFMSPSTNVHDFDLRVIEIIIGFVICAYSFYKHHHKHNSDVQFVDTLKTFDWKSDVTQWQLKVILGISIIIFIGQSLNIPRNFWMAIAALSILLPFGDYSKAKRVFERIGGVIVGCILFMILFYLLPPAYSSLIGPIGGFFIGFSTTYHWNSVFNCFGSLALAAAIYGPKISIELRVFNNVLGCIAALVFVIFYTCVLTMLFKNKETNA